MKKRVTLDFETRSEAPLKTWGAYKYSLHHSTRATCLAFKLHKKPQLYFLPFEIVNSPWDTLPKSFKNLWTSLIEDRYQFSAHNAFFETCIYKNILVKRNGWPDIPFELFRCTAAKAAACALPRNLEGAGAAMSLRVQKDKRGYAAMMATCKPTRAWEAWNRKFEKGKADRWLEPTKFREPNNDPEVFKVLYHYCKIDVITEELLDDALPDLNKEEMNFWFLNQKLNWRGLRIDYNLINKIIQIMDKESKKKLKELDSLTMGLVTKPGARKSILEFLALEGIELPDLRANTVKEKLNDETISEDMKRLLEIRQALSKTSTRKFKGMIDRASFDKNQLNAKVRDITLYHGASTGRETGTGIQPHNYPRPLIKQNEIDYVIQLLEKLKISNQDDVSSFVEWIEFFYGNSSMVFSSLLRSMIIPGEGKELFVADFSKIEVAVLWWLCDNKPGLEVLHKKLDPYIYMAAKNAKKFYGEIDPEGDERQLGKAQILGCGFGMGFKKFRDTARDSYNLKLTIKESKEAVKNYREQNPNVPEFWRNAELAAIAAIEAPGKSFTTCKCSFIVEKDFLWIELPSGRKLAYKSPRITWRVRQYEVLESVLDKFGEPLFDSEGNEVTTLKKVTSEPLKTIEFMAVNSRTKKWGPEITWGGTLVENIVQAVARDIMMNASYNLEKAHYMFLLSVHDEGITEKEIGKGNLKEFIKIMTKMPPWADRYLPLDAKGWVGRRYKK